MNSLDDAWKWYLSSKEQHALLARIAHKYWEDLPWDGRLGRDERLKGVDEAQLVKDLDLNLGQLDDLAILVLFATFEALVRTHLAAEVRIAGAVIEHPVLIDSLQEVIQRIEMGSFYRVIASFKFMGDEAKRLIEQVNQVRGYRNWVAHGKRGPQPNSVTPEMAMDRLSRFYDIFVSSNPPLRNSDISGDEVHAD